jgi:glycosyltransferase involved in cell wall biosynthesis
MRSLPRIAIAGPMVGRTPGFTTTQGEYLTDLLRESGYDVVSTSTQVSRVRRLVDTLRTLRRELPRVDALIVETYSGPSFVVEDSASRLAARTRTPVIFHLHGGGMPRFARRFRGWTCSVLRRATAIVAPSKYLARELEPIVGPIDVIPNVIELDSYPRRLRRSVRPRLLWMRAFHEVYNPVMAIEVLKCVQEVCPDATLVMAGQSKGSLTEVVAAIRRLGLEDAVELPGFLDMRGKADAASRCDVFINTTHVDNAPVGVVEMCAFGLPVVSTSVGGVPDLLDHGQTALLVPDGDVRAMSDAIVRLVHEPALAERLSSTGPELAARFSWPLVRPMWESLFERVRFARGAVA